MFARTQRNPTRLEDSVFGERRPRVRPSLPSIIRAIFNLLVYPDSVNLVHVLFLLCGCKDRSILENSDERGQIIIARGQVGKE